ncbi:type I-E CRISPR-associated protein Cse1/CasA [Streptomyces zagrosensis]|uniref:CRISPR system Cascade subunit CasA n=1 Tax=Streptomyces zagrosensis TaxID=1042984 RepID=A0A7W9Q5D7_9ACTN|nr:type I-E CRISPR-associated protein Cse1/CasA [Streptomyces zagrosensis]MBB5933938.1 CRISPR system Cascade subunit CasA [Streptomyces zagrosensis]
MSPTSMPAGPPQGNAPFPNLSPAAKTVWAKHDRPSDSWLPLWRHMADSAAASGKLWDEWVPRNVKWLVAEAFPEGDSDARLALTFLAAAHDTGKATPAFSCQVDPLADHMRTAGLHMRTAKEYGTDRRMAPHGLAGQLLLQEWLAAEHGLSARVSGQFAVVAGGHHGVPPEHQQIHDLQLRPHLLRHPGSSEALWRSVQYEFMDGCAELTGVRERLRAWREVRLPQPVQVVLTAVVILADWIASSPELFPYDPASWLPAGPAGEARRLQAAWQGLDLPGPWAPEEPEQPADVLFAERFDLPPGARIRPVQAETVRMARAMPAAGLLMIEAPMGEGKTEAAFAAAEILAARTGAGGCLVALPTRATGDAMFPRLLAWLDRLPLGGPRSVVLAHAKAALNDVWAGMMQHGQRSIMAVEMDASERAGERRVQQTDQASEVRERRAEPAGLHAHQWLRGRKKSLLASFAVGTIDQVLFAGLKSRHLALRHLAVAGKVVIIDEVHAYDAYMSRYLDRVLGWLAAYHVPVVLLSATLPADRRRALLAAYARAGEAAEASSHDGRGAPDDTDYPLITAVAPGVEPLTARPATASGRRTEVSVERLGDDLPTLIDRLAAELVDGGCALVVRNTVDRVLEAADALRGRFGDGAVTVAHSRFLAADRAARDAELRNRFGPNGDRPTGLHIVVASQVIEQSLDIDFDLLVTDLAPADLLLQRMGRLHRHPRARPPRLSQARCLVTGVEDWQESPPAPVRGSIAVYQGEFTLLRALAVLGPHLDGAPLVLPDHISTLVQAAYGKAPVGPANWADALHEAHDKHVTLLADKRSLAESFLLGPVRRAGRPLYGWLGAGAGDTDDTGAGRAQVRDSAESLEVLVVRRLRDGRLTTVPWLDRGRGGLELSTDFPPDRRAAEAVAASAISLPWQFSGRWSIDRTIAELERFAVPAWQAKECPWLAGELILVLDEDCQTRLAGFRIRYSSADGLRVSSASAPTTAPGLPGNGAGSGEDEARERTAEEPGARTVSADAPAPDPTAADGTHTGAGSESRASAGAFVVTGGVAEVGAVATGPAAEAPVVASVNAPAGPPSFDLLTAPWVPVQRIDGSIDEVSLREVFVQASKLRRLVGDLPTQEFALLRLLLAIVYDALDGPEELEDWSELWHDADPFAAVPGYLDQHRARFDLLHPREPFFQVADLRTAKDEVASLNRIVADVPNGDPFFAMRRPGVERLSCAEAARWLVHTHAFDPAGIKSGMVGDRRAKAGKVYPLGVGSVGTLGGVYAEGATLRETLLLNLIPLREDVVGVGDADAGASDCDLPAWRRPPVGPGPDDEPGGRRPRGLRDLYTWQSRRVRLHHRDGQVTGVVLGYGDPLQLASPWRLEPMSGWRRSPTQEKKQGRSTVYMPQQHDPSRAAWRGLAGLLRAQRAATDEARREAAKSLPPAVVTWASMLATEGELPSLALIRVRLVGMQYGTQQSVVDEVVDDAVVLPVIVLHGENPIYGSAAIDAVDDADKAVRALSQLAGNLARAVGSESGSAMATARDMGFGALDGPYRKWLTSLAAYSDPQEARARWQVTVRRYVLRLGRTLLNSAGSAASEGRVADIPGLGSRWINDARAELWFRSRLKQVLSLADSAAEGAGAEGHVELAPTPPLSGTGSSAGLAHKASGDHEHGDDDDDEDRNDHDKHNDQDDQDDGKGGAV